MKLRGSWLASLLLLTFAGTAAAEVTFTPLEDLAGGAFHADFVDLTDAGVPYGFSEGPSQIASVVRWHGGVPEELPAAPGIGAVSGDGSTIVAGRWHYEIGVGTTLLDDLPGGATISIASDLNTDGSVAVGYGSGVTELIDTDSMSFFIDARHAARWTNLAIEDLHRGTCVEGVATAVSADGSTVVGYDNWLGHPVSHCVPDPTIWRFRNGARENVSIQGLGPNRIHALSADGTIGAGLGFLGPPINPRGVPTTWDDNGSPTVLELPDPNAYGEALAISHDGSVVGGWADPPGALGAMGAAFWVNGTYVRLHDFLAAEGIDLTGWDLQRVEGVSADGQILAGQGTNPSGDPQGFVVHLAATPVPSLGWIGLALLAGVITALGSSRPRHDAA